MYQGYQKSATTCCTTFHICKNLPSLEVNVFIAAKVIGDIGNAYSPWMTSFDWGMPRYLETIRFTCGQWGDKTCLYAIVDDVIIL